MIGASGAVFVGGGSFVLALNKDRFNGAGLFKFQGHRLLNGSIETASGNGVLIAVQHIIRSVDGTEVGEPGSGYLLNHKVTVFINGGFRNDRSGIGAEAHVEDTAAEHIAHGNTNGVLAVLQNGQSVGQIDFIVFVVLVAFSVPNLFTVDINGGILVVNNKHGQLVEQFNILNRKSGPQISGIVLVIKLGIGNRLCPTGSGKGSLTGKIGVLSVAEP